MPHRHGVLTADRRRSYPAGLRATDAGGYTTVTEQDALGRVVVVTDAAKGFTRYTYGPFGWLTTVTDPGGALTRSSRAATRPPGETSGAGVVSRRL